MSDRTHIVISGPAGAGKTTFIERILTSNRSRSIDAVRWRACADVAVAMDVLEGCEDTRRLEQAGADLTSLIVHPPGELHQAGKALYETEVMLTIQDGILHEVDEFFDIRQEMTVLIIRPEGEFGAAFEQLLKHGLALANLVIFNVDSAKAQDLAEKLDEGIEVLRTEDPECWRRIRSNGGTCVRITTRFMDLSDPRDAELKRAVQSVKRKLPTESFISNEELEGLLGWETPEPGVGVLRVKVTLENTDPPIWRRLLLPQDCTFWDLHVAIQDSMGWEGDHLHAFQLQGGKGLEPLVIGLPGPFGGMDVIPGWTQEVLEHVRPAAGFRYTYDFGDDWKHGVEIEDLEPAEPGRSYPSCIDGARRCPPEDCGGPFSYQDLLKAIRDPDHARHAEAVDSWGESFDPEDFDPNRVRFGDPRARLHWATGG